MKTNVHNEGYYIKLPVFEGPFDLLFHLINREELDIWDIPLGKITSEYLDYIQSMRELEVELAGEFLVMASSLLQLKSRMLLPSLPQRLSEKEEEELFFGSKEELVRCILEYRKVKIIAQELKAREKEQQKIYLRYPNQQKMVIINRQATLYPYAYDSLKQAVINFRKRKEKEQQEPEPVPVPYENLSFKNTVKLIMNRINNITASVFTLDEVMKKRKSRAEVVATFFALLELARRGQLSLLQHTAFGPINISKNNSSKESSE